MVKAVREQIPMLRGYDASAGAGGELRDAAVADNKAQPVHRWVPWIAGYSAQFVADAIDAYLPRDRREEALVLDPFAGVGTTLLEALKAGCNTIGYEINPFAALAARSKVHCVDVDVQAFRTEVAAFRQALQRFEAEVDDRNASGGAEALLPMFSDLELAAPKDFRSRIPFFSPPVEAKFLYALKRASVLLEPDRSLLRAALGATMISYSNYSYEPSLGSRPGAGKPLIENASVAKAVCEKLGEMLEDIGVVTERYSETWGARRREVVLGSYFDSKLPPASVSLLVTSPPYMNNYHYVRNTRAHLHWLDLLGGTIDLRSLEQSSFGKFWQTVRQGPVIELNTELPELASAVDRLRVLSVERGQYGGPGWANYVATYFNDTGRFLESVKGHLEPGAYAVIVVGNSIIQGIEFKVDHILAELAERRGLLVDGIRIVRTKRVGNSIIDSSVRNGNGAHAHPTQLYDAAVILRAKGQTRP